MTTEETRAPRGRERTLYGVLWEARGILSRCNLDGSANLSREAVARLRKAVADFDAEDARPAPPPEESGRTEPQWTVREWKRIDKAIHIDGPGTLHLTLDHDDVDVDDVEARLPGIVDALNREPPFPGAPASSKEGGR